MDAKEIKSLRKKRKQTQTQFADELGVTKTTVLNWENEFAKPSKLAQRQLARMERDKC